MEWLEAGTYTYEDQHPPLARVMGAVGLYLAGARMKEPRDPDKYREGYRLLGYTRHYTRSLYYSRLAMLPLFWVGAATVFIWCRRIAGAGAAVAATLVFTTTPPILAHAGLVTTDMAVTAFTGAAVLCALCWTERPDWRRSILLGVMTGLAMLSKLSALVFLPAGLVAMFAWHLARDRPGFESTCRRALHLAPFGILALGTAALIIWSGYRFSWGWVQFLGRPVPAPAFFNGMQSVWEHQSEGHPAYLLGRRSQTGFFYYYPLVFAVKTPLAMLVLFLISLVLAARRRPAMNIGMPLAFASGVFAVALFSHINIGVRHILPVYIGMAVCCGVAVSRLLRQWRVPSTLTVCALLAWQVASGALQHPDYIAYTNELTGNRPERILADSDLDWDQSMKRLALRLGQLGVHEFTFKIFSAGYMAAGNDFPFFIHDMPDGDRPTPGWNAISITPWKLSGQPRWAEQAVPRERIGRSILLYYFPP
jgi:4-amino-4-deoxy-L-arabinose transferase-like glycosyltransferase